MTSSMAPLITLYILGGCVAAAGILFLVMIVFSALRPPRLPEADAAPPPIQRVIRALTPRAVPLVPATLGPPIDDMFDNDEPTRPLGPRNAIKLVTGAQPPPAPRSAVPPPLPGVAPTPPSLPGVLSRSAVTEFEAPRRMVPKRAPAPPPPPPRPVAPPPAPSSESRPTAPSRPMPASFAAAPALMPSRWSPDSTSPGSFASTPSSVAARLPVYPSHRGRTIARIIGVLVGTVVLASAVAIARPSLLDPLCDDLDWFGSNTAIAVRDHARDANAALTPYVDALAFWR